MFEFEKFSGHYILWPFAGMEELVKKTSIKGGTNKFIVPVTELNIYNNLKDIKYVSNLNRVYFIRESTQKTVFSQNFPDAGQHKPKDVRKTIEIDRERFSKNYIDKKEFDEYNFIKLASTKNHLFALVRLHTKEYALLKIIVSDYGGFSPEMPYINKLILTDNIDEDIDLFAVDINANESTIYLFLKNSQKILWSKFKDSKDRTINLTDLGKELNEKVVPKAFCLYRNKNKTELAILDGSKLKLFVENDEKKKNRFKVKKVFDLENKDYFRIEYFSINANNLNTQETTIRTDPENMEAEQILLFSNNQIKDIEARNAIHDQNKKELFEIIRNQPEIDTLSLKSEKTYSLMGKGKVSLEGGFHSNLNEYRFDKLSYSYIILGNAMIFGDTGSAKMYALLTPRSRDIFFSPTNRLIGSNTNYDDGTS